VVFDFLKTHCMGRVTRISIPGQIRKAFERRLSTQPDGNLTRLIPGTVLANAEWIKKPFGM